jgi:hypothetical protein
MCMCVFMHNITCMFEGKADLSGHVCLAWMFYMWSIMMIMTILIVSFMLSLAEGRDDTLWRSLPGLPISAIAAHRPPPMLMSYCVFVGASGNRVAVDAPDEEAMWGLSTLFMTSSCSPPMPTVATSPPPFVSLSTPASKGTSLILLYSIAAFVFIYELDWT